MTHVTAVADRELDLALEELAGRESPPDHLAAILQRTRMAPTAPTAAATGARWLLAAAALAGLAVTSALGWLARHDPAAAATAIAGQPTVQDPPPRQPPSQQQEPKKAPTEATRKDGPKQEDKPKPAPDGKQEQAKPPAKKHAGSDAADLRAQRSAEAMLAAEKKLTQMLKEGKIAGVDAILPFETLTSWQYQKGLEGCSDAVKKLDGKKVLMTGFMLPIDEVRDIRQFLLVKSLWACCYGKPPDVNGIVRCVMPKGKTTDYQFEPLKIVGTLRVQETVEDGYCVDVYQLHVDLLEVIE